MGDEDSLIEGLGRLDELQRMGGASRVRRVAHAEDRKAAGNASFKAKELDKAIHNYLGAYTFRNLNNIIISPPFSRADAIWLLRAEPAPEDMPLASGCVPRGEIAAGLLGPKGEAKGVDAGDAAFKEKVATLIRSLHGNISMVALKVEDYA